MALWYLFSVPASIRFWNLFLPFGIMPNKTCLLLWCSLLFLVRGWARPNMAAFNRILTNIWDGARSQQLGLHFCSGLIGLCSGSLKIVYRRWAFNFFAVSRCNHLDGGPPRDDIGNFSMPLSPKTAVTIFLCFSIRFVFYSFLQAVTKLRARACAAFQLMPVPSVGMVKLHRFLQSQNFRPSVIFFSESPKIVATAK